MVVLVVLLLAVGSAFADTQFHYLGGGSNIWQNIYVSPYYGETLPGFNPVTLYCLDYNYDIRSGDTWWADVLPLNDASMPETYYGSTTSYNRLTGWSGVTADFDTTANLPGLTRYQMAAYLFDQVIALQSSGDPDKLQKEQELNVAAWSLFVNSSNGNLDDFKGRLNLSGQAFVEAAVAYLNSATAAVTGNTNYGMGTWEIISSEGAGEIDGQPWPWKQEFMTPVPEPASILLIGTLLWGVSGLLKRKLT